MVFLHLLYLPTDPGEEKNRSAWRAQEASLGGITAARSTGRADSHA